MTMTNSTRTSPIETGTIHPNTLDAQYQLRRKLGEYMRETRLASKVPYTQMQLSEALGYTYSIVTSWENGGRNVLLNHLLSWAEKLGVDTDMAQGPLARFAPVLLPDEASKPNKGERIEKEVNARLKLLRQERNLSLREMAEITGINYSHYSRVESNRSNLSVVQIRLLCQRLRVTYDYIIDGTHKDETTQALRDRIKTLERENELLESFRQSYIKR